MIGRKKPVEDAPVQDAPIQDAPIEDAPVRPAGKGHATPKRKEAEAANKRPLVATTTDRKDAAKRQRNETRAARDLEYQAMLSGDERHMPARDAGPVKRFARDWIDARFCLGSYFLPVAAVFMLVALLTLNQKTGLIFVVLTAVLYLYVFAVLIDSVLIWFRLKAAITRRFGPAAVRGNLFYAVLRSTQLRRTRLPRPQVKRGQAPR